MKIVDLEVEKVAKRLKTKEIELVLDAATHEFLIEKGYDPAYGARPMRRAVERFLEDPMAEEILRGGIKPGETVTVSVSGSKLVFNSEGSKPEDHNAEAKAGK